MIRALPIIKVWLSPSDFDCWRRDRAPFHLWPQGRKRRFAA
jgi:hypothetical protein